MTETKQQHRNKVHNKAQDVKKKIMQGIVVALLVQAISLYLLQRATLCANARNEEMRRNG